MTTDSNNATLPCLLRPGAWLLLTAVLLLPASSLRSEEGSAEEVWERSCGVGPEDFGADGDKFALLVSVNHYEDESMPTLAGPSRDMDKLCAALVSEKHGFLPQNILRIHGAEATRAQFLDALDSLATRSSEGRTLVFGFAGHGSQVEDNDGTEEPDGKDETLCPYDRSTQGDIRDDHIRDKVDGLLSGGAHVVTIFDSCHSGSATRSLGDTIFRTVHDASPAGAPYDGSSRDAGGTLLGDLARSERLTVLAAAGDKQFAGERSYADEEGNPVVSGIFSRSLLTVLAESRPGASWKELAPRIGRGMRTSHRQNAEFSGNLDVEIFGTRNVSDIAHFQVTRTSKEGARIRVDATFHGGIGEGAVLAAFAPGAELDGSSAPLARYRVSKVTQRSATAEFIEGEGAAQVVIGAPVTVLIPSASVRARQVVIDDSVHPEVRTELEKKLRNAPLVEWVDPSTTPLRPDHFLVRALWEDSQCVAIEGGVGRWPQVAEAWDDRASEGTHGGPCELGGKTYSAQDVRDAIVQSARWQRFKGLTNPLEEDFEASRLLDVTIDRISPQGIVPWTVQDSRPRHPETGDFVGWLGDRIRPRYTNTSDHELGVTLLYMSSNGEITLLNQDKFKQKLQQGQSIDLGPRGTFGTPCGTDYIKVFVTMGTPFDPSPYIVKNSTKRSATRGEAKPDAATDSLDWQLDTVFSEAYDPKKTTRSTRGGSSGQWSVLTIPVRVSAPPGMAKACNQP